MAINFNIEKRKYCKTHSYRKYFQSTYLPYKMFYASLHCLFVLIAGEILMMITGVFPTITAKTLTTSSQYDRLLIKNNLITNILSHDEHATFLPIDRTIIDSIRTDNVDFRQQKIEYSKIRATTKARTGNDSSKSIEIERNFSQTTKNTTNEIPILTRNNNVIENSRVKYNRINLENNRKNQKNQMKYENHLMINDKKDNPDEFNNTKDYLQFTHMNKDDIEMVLLSLEDLFINYMANNFNMTNIKEELISENNLNYNNSNNNNQLNIKRNEKRSLKPANKIISIKLAKTLSSGRKLLSKGLKKLLWPLYSGFRLLQSSLFALIVPTILSTLTSFLGKGLAEGSAPLFIRAKDVPQELDFRDNGVQFEDANYDFIPYEYNQAEASQINNQYVMNSLGSMPTLTKLGLNERQQQLMQNSYMNVLQTIGSASVKASNSFSSDSFGLVSQKENRPTITATNGNNFQTFQKVPESTLLLSNYDPFYSPLLSRLDSIFGQLKLTSDNEICREKVICLMYAYPAKYAPYSNLVSAQLSRELNELRKPTTDNPDILRFFKYMRAAKDGQDDADCDKIYADCTEFEDFDNPAMVSTFHDINKLVEARKF